MKNFIKVLMVTGILTQLLALAAFAEEKVGDDIPTACSSINLRIAPLGMKCKTSKGGHDGKGAIFERVSRDNFGEAWKGPDGVIWSDRTGSDTQFNAVYACENLGGELPSRANFERGEANGFREVLPNMKDHWFWSSSVNPSDPYYGNYFSGNYGDIGDTSRNNGKFSVRCVGR